MTERRELFMHSRKPAMLGAPVFWGVIEAKNQHVTVILGGVQESGCRPGSSIEQLMLQFGDLLVVKYPSRGRFNLKRIAGEVLRHVKSYKEVTLDCISGGAKLGQEIIRRAKEMKLKTIFRLILDSAPSGFRTLKSGLRLPALASFIVPASLLPLYPRFSWRFYGWINGAKPDVLPPHAARFSSSQLNELKTHHRLTNERPAGTFIRETRALIVLAPEPDAEVLRGIPSAFIISARDEIVDTAAAFCMWAEKIGDPALMPLFVDSQRHADHHAFPAEWLKAYERTFAGFGLKPLTLAA